MHYSFFVNTVNFISDTVFFGTPYFNSDIGGFAVVKAGEREARIVFGQEYLATPVVSANISLEDGLTYAYNDFLKNVVD